MGFGRRSNTAHSPDTARKAPRGEEGVGKYFAASPREGSRTLAERIDRRDPGGAGVGKRKGIAATPCIQEHSGITTLWGVDLERQHNTLCVLVVANQVSVDSRRTQVSRRHILRRLLYEKEAPSGKSW